MLKVHDIHIRVESSTKLTVVVSAAPEVPFVGKIPAQTIIEKSSLIVKEGFIPAADLRDFC